MIQYIYIYIYISLYLIYELDSVTSFVLCFFLELLSLLDQGTDQNLEVQQGGTSFSI
jgi:hypothetical protein